MTPRVEDTVARQVAGAHVDALNQGLAALIRARASVPVCPEIAYTKLTALLRGAGLAQE